MSEFDRKWKPSGKPYIEAFRWRKVSRVRIDVDLFAHDRSDKWIDAVFAAMALTPQHTFQIITKHPRRMREYAAARDARQCSQICQAIDAIPYEAGGNRRGALEMPLPNVWFGVSVQNQAQADERIPDLLATPAARRWVYAEPLGPMDYRRWLPGAYECAAVCGWRSGDAPSREVCHTCRMTSERFGEFCSNCGAQNFGALCPCCESDAVHGHPDTPRLDWVVVGGESGPDARPMHPDWARSIRDQCAAAGVKFFFKEWGEFYPLTPHAGGDLGGYLRSGFVRHVCRDRENDGRFREGDLYMCRFGKARTGRLLDGLAHDAMPRAR